MLKEDVLNRIRDTGVVAVVRADSSERALKIAEACLEGGLTAIEITFTVPRAHQLIADLRKRFSENELLLGAGTVLDPETARIAILEGASYIVSPHLNVETVRLCNRYRIPSMPGAMSLTEVIACMEAGADIVKVFPAELFGPAIVKAFLGPLPQAQLMPTGGVSLENAAEWIKAGSVALGAGSTLIAGAQTGDWKAVAGTARAFVQAVKNARAR